MTKIIVVEDEENIAETLKYNFVREGYDVTTIKDGRFALEIFKQEKPDLMILDLMLPGINGLDICRQIRLISTIPILILTAREEELDKILGLELGADNYMTKPFNLREVIARVRAMLRRVEMHQSYTSTGGGTAPGLHSEVLETGTGSEPENQNQLKVGDLIISSKEHTVTSGGRSIMLKPKEFNLLIFMARHPGQVLTRELLLEQVWDYNYNGGTRTVDVHIRWLREKIEVDPSKPLYIHTVFGVGYKLEVKDTKGDSFKV